LNVSDVLFDAAGSNDANQQNQQIEPELDVHPSSSLTMVGGS
jgi:hypothetical protein